MLWKQLINWSLMSFHGVFVWKGFNKYHDFWLTTHSNFLKLPRKDDSLNWKYCNWCSPLWLVGYHVGEIQYLCIIVTWLFHYYELHWWYTTGVLYFVIIVNFSKFHFCLSRRYYFLNLMSTCVLARSFGKHVLWELHCFPSFLLIWVFLQMSVNLSHNLKATTVFADHVRGKPVILFVGGRRRRVWSR